MNKITRIAFFGTPDLVIPILDEMENSGFVPQLIVTGEDAAKGRHLMLKKPAAKIWAEERNIPLLQPAQIDATFLEEFKKYEIDLGVVVAYVDRIASRRPDDGQPAE